MKRSFYKEGNKIRKKRFVVINNGRDKLVLIKR